MSTQRLLSCLHSHKLPFYHLFTLERNHLLKTYNELVCLHMLMLCKFKQAWSIAVIVRDYCSLDTHTHTVHTHKQIHTRLLFSLVSSAVFSLMASLHLSTAERGPWWNRWIHTPSACRQQNKTVDQNKKNRWQMETAVVGDKVVMTKTPKNPQAQENHIQRSIETGDNGTQAKMDIIQKSGIKKKEQ